LSIELFAGGEHAALAKRSLHAFGFVENHGQWPEALRFVSETARGAVGVEHAALRFRDLARDDDGEAVASDLWLRFEQARFHVRPIGDDPAGRVVSYYQGRDPSRWSTAEPVFRRVVWEGLYPGVDVVVRESEAAPGQLEYDLLLAPGADLERVVVLCDGAEELSIDGDGTLLVRQGDRLLRQSPPQTWTLRADGTREPILCRYRQIDATRFGFSADGWTGDLPLFIDPVVSWVVEFGSGPGDPWSDYLWDLDVTEQGEVIAVGQSEWMGHCVAPVGEDSSNRIRN